MAMSVWQCPFGNVRLATLAWMKSPRREGPRGAAGLRRLAIIIDDARSKPWREGNGVDSSDVGSRCGISRLLYGGGQHGAIAMTKTDLAGIYRHYIACLNRQDWPKLGQFVADEVHHNGRLLGLSGYCEMLERDFDQIPDLHFEIRLLVCDAPHVASRLRFNCTPKGMFLGLHVDGRRVSFTENVFYEFQQGKIAQVWSIIDKAAIEAQL
jgi:predicted ester cyclase